MLDAITGALQSRCDEAGFDIFHPFCLDWFNDAVEPSLRLPDGGRRGALGLLIGNTQRLWPVFARALRSDAALLEGEHPLDAYVEKALTLAITQSLRERHQIFSHIR